MHEAEIERNVFQLAELVRVIVADHRRVRGGGTQVLADCEDLATDRAQVGEGCHQLVMFFAETDHEPRLRRDDRREAACPVEQFQRSRVAAARTGHAIQARHRLGIVVEDVGPRIEHGTERVFVAPKIGNQDLDAALRQAGAGLTNRLREDRGAAVAEVVAVDRCDHDIGEIQRTNRIRDADRLVNVERRRPSVRDGTV